MYRQMWKLDKEGNYTSIRQGHAYCNLCKDVKQVVETVLAERVHWTYSEIVNSVITSVQILLAIFGIFNACKDWDLGQ